jgi:hypothetical protein
MDYTVYPHDFHERGVCWTFRRITKARTKAASLGVGSWIRRYINVTEKHSGKSDFQIVRFWLWNGVRFVRLTEEPPAMKLFTAKTIEQNPTLKAILR